MKLTLEHYDEKVVIETERNDLDIYEVSQLLKQLLMGAGYHSDSVKEVITYEV